MEKEMKKLENVEVEKVSGGGDVEKIIIKEYEKPLPKCPKCGRPMHESPGYAYFGTDNKVHSKPFSYRCSYCDLKDFDLSKIKKKKG